MNRSEFSFMRMVALVVALSAASLLSAQERGFFAPEEEGKSNARRLETDATHNPNRTYECRGPISMVTDVGYEGVKTTAFNFAVCGGFFAEWDDGDIHVALHEIGHLSGGDHNPKSSRHGPDDPQITARDWYSCEESIYVLLSYNVCDKWLQTVEMYSGLNAIYAGNVRGNEMQNNVGTFVKVFEFMKGEHE